VLINKLRRICITLESFVSEEEEEEEENFSAPKNFEYVLFSPVTQNSKKFSCVPFFVVVNILDDLAPACATSMLQNPDLS
jgi:hypothetical protein